MLDENFKEALEEGLELMLQLDKGFVRESRFVDGKIREFALVPTPYDGAGLVPVVVQDDSTKEILMLAYANTEALQKTIDTGNATFYSRSRKKLWTKGEEKSGNYLLVKGILVDCDQDALVYKVEPVNERACHTGRKTCFYRRYNARIGAGTLEFIEGMR